MQPHFRSRTSLTKFAVAFLVTAASAPRAQNAGYSLRFFGTGSGDVDRCKIRIDDSATTLPGPPADVGATDFTIEFWVRGTVADNPSPPVGCGANIAWIYGNILLDRDRYNQDRKFGLSFAGGRAVWGVSGDGTGDRTICGTTVVLDGAWHHVAVQRRRTDGHMWLFVDGALEASADGPDGDVSYPDDGVPGPYCGGPCTWSDPFLVLGAEKHDAGPAYPSFRGWLDELRLSTVLRYATTFAPPTAPFVPDPVTAALWHFDEGNGTVATDASGAAQGPSLGTLAVGGPMLGPVWSIDTPFTTPCARLASSDLAIVNGVVQFVLASPCQPGALYVAACSLATAPAIVIGPHVVHLTPDALFDVSLGVPTHFQNFIGVLDAQGRGSCQVLVHPVLAGLSFYTAFVTVDSSSPTLIGTVAYPFGAFAH